MVIVTATMWPQGNPAHAYELLHVGINNRSSLGDESESYMAHVLARPNLFYGIEGFEADVEVRGHQRTAGFGPLLISVLGSACVDAQHKIAVPEARLMSRILIKEARDFEEVLRKGGRK